MQNVCRQKHKTDVNVVRIADLGAFRLKMNCRRTEYE